MQLRTNLTLTATVLRDANDRLFGQVANGMGRTDFAGRTLNGPTNRPSVTTYLHEPTGRPETEPSRGSEVFCHTPEDPSLASPDSGSLACPRWPDPDRDDRAVRAGMSRGWLMPAFSSAWAGRLPKPQPGQRQRGLIARSLALLIPQFARLGTLARSARTRLDDGIGRIAESLAGVIPIHAPLVVSTWDSISVRRGLARRRASVPGI